MPMAACLVMFASSAIAFGTSSYLAWASLTSSPVAGCGGGSIFNCSHVLHSRWSSVLSIPVSIPAMAIHAFVLGMLLSRPSWQPLQTARWAIVGFAALSAGAAAIWFIGLQVFWIEHLCSYCLVAHTAGLIIAGLFLWYRPIPIAVLGWVGAASVAGISGLIFLQSQNAMPKTYEVIDHSERVDETGSPVVDDTLLFEAPQPVPQPQAWLNQRMHHTIANATASFVMSLSTTSHLSGAIAVNAEDEKKKAAIILSSLRLETHAWPLLGKPDAELVFVELFDYTCDHCQRTHKALDVAREKMGDRLAIIALPVPIDIKCNPTVKSTDANHAEACDLAKLAIAVWSIDHSKFEEFHSYLFTAKPKYAQALAKASETVDSEKLKETLKTNLPAEYIAKHVAIYQKAGAGNIPKLMFPKSTSVGAIESSAVILSLIEQNLK
jgi:uncharacterized membrane protein/protein-disulfide isomerase